MPNVGKLLNVALPNVVKSTRTSAGTLVEWAKDGRKLITYPPSHKYYSKHAINQVEIVKNDLTKVTTVSFLRNGKPIYEGFTMYSPRAHAINPAGDGMIGNLGQVLRCLA